MDSICYLSVFVRVLFLSSSRYTTKSKPPQIVQRKYIPNVVADCDEGIAFHPFIVQCHISNLQRFEMVANRLLRADGQARKIDPLTHKFPVATKMRKEQQH